MTDWYETQNDITKTTPKRILVVVPKWRHRTNVKWNKKKKEEYFLSDIEIPWGEWRLVLQVIKGQRDNPELRDLRRKHDSRLQSSLLFLSQPANDARDATGEMRKHKHFISLVVNKGKQLPINFPYTNWELWSHNLQNNLHTALTADFLCAHAHNLWQCSWERDWKCDISWRTLYGIKSVFFHPKSAHFTCFIKIYVSCVGIYVLNNFVNAKDFFADQFDLRVYNVVVSIWVISLFRV